MLEASTKEGTKGVGRPPHPDKLAIWERFIASVEDGDTLKQATAKAGAAWSSIARWCSDTTTVDGTGVTFAQRYARARLTSASAFADTALTVAMSADPDTAQVARLQVDTLKWRAAMANPKEYGDRRQVEVSGGIEHLHLAALQSLTAKSRTVNTLDTTPAVKQLASVIDADVQPIDTEEGP